MSSAADRQYQQASLSSPCQRGPSPEKNHDVLVLQYIMRGRAVALALIVFMLIAPPWRPSAHLSTTPHLTLNTLQPPPSSDTLPPLPATASTAHQIADAVAWSAVAIVPKAARSTMNDDGNSELADKLLASLQYAESAVPPHSQQPEAKPSTSRLPRLPRQQCASGNDDAAAECLGALVSKIGSWDHEAGRYVPPTREQIPPRPGRPKAWRAKKASIVSELATAEVHPPPPDRTEGRASEQRHRVEEQIRAGLSREAEAEQRWHYASRVLAPRTKRNAGRECWSVGRCNGQTGPCLWCGARVCCRPNCSDDHALCRDAHGGLSRHVCSPTPQGAASTILDALTPWSKLARPDSLHSPPAVRNPRRPNPWWHSTAVFAE